MQTLKGVFAFAAGAFILCAQPKVSSVVNSATFSNGIGYSSIVTIFGTGLAVESVAATALPLPSKLGATEALFCNAQSDIETDWINCQNGVLLYAGPSQVNAVIPDLPGNYYNPFAVEIRIRVNGVDDQGYASNAPVTFTMISASPGIYRPGYDCAYPVSCAMSAVQNAVQSVQRGALSDSLTGELVSSENPMVPQRYYSLYLTGAGVPWATNAGIYDLQISPSFYTIYADNPDLGATIFPQFIGLVPGYAGFDQVNLAMPSNLLQIFTDGSTLPQCSAVTEIKRELYLTARGTTGPVDTISVPVWIQPGELDCNQ